MKYTMTRLSEDECYEILRQIDIKIAIDYFGVAELLDHIEDSVIKSYLINNQEDAAVFGAETLPKPVVRLKVG